MNVNEAWSKLFEKYDILNKIQSEGAFFITANQIKKFKEPRLMAKWDSSENLPSIFKKHNINILPISRNGYVLSDFKLYEPIPELGEHITEMQKVEIPEYETIDIGNISSEANAINVLMLSKILDDFLDEENKTTEEIAETMEFDLRQSDYYYNAGKYLGLFEKKDVEDEEKIVKKVSLSKLGKDTVKLRYKERQLKLVSLILEHEIFNKLFIKVYNSGQLPTKKAIQNIMRENNVCNEGQIVRRSSSVYSWLKWIFNLQNI